MENLATDVTLNTDSNIGLVKLHELALSEHEIKVMNDLLSQSFPPQEIENFYYLQINRGLSKAKKIAAKPHNLYPLLIKLSTVEDISDEYGGYKKLLFRVNTSNLLRCEGIAYHGAIGGIAYHYVTRGRVRDTYDRLDVIPKDGAKEESDRVNKIINNVLDSALKKSHFSHGLPKDIRPVKMHMEDTRIFTDHFFTEKEKIELLAVYNRIISNALNIMAPFGTVHGDLHPKNILVGMNDTPILIDYNYVRSGECIFTDYAKLEVYMLTMFPQNVTTSFFDRNLFERQYSSDPLILPRSERCFLSSAIFEIRKILWKNCMSNNIAMNYLEIDIVYRAYLAYHFLRMAKKTGVSRWARDVAYNAILNLGGAK